jgi:AmiR/NasT family two-component response regulator
VEQDNKFAAVQAKIAANKKKNKVNAEMKKAVKALEARKKIDPAKKGLFVKSGCQ